MSNTPSRPRRPCTQCGRSCRTASGICGPCAGTADNTILTGGRWVTVGGVRRWRPWTPEECRERTTKALATLPEYIPGERERQARARRLRVAQLVAERYGDADWWKSLPVIPATPQTGRERLNAAVADAERFDLRTRAAREVA